jgi:chorismate mutase
MDLEFDGLIIETHVNPDSALSDAGQQLTPEALHKLLARLVLRRPDIQNQMLLSSLEDLRREIDNYDEPLWRYWNTDGNIQKNRGIQEQNNITILQTGRWDEILRSRIEKPEKKTWRGIYY